ncbi:MAG: flagellar hook-associated protein FlgK [Thermodesulfobacteriota bacterium]|nr:flagellar hook-associated protein FlgK [Thermodesulfobacteriota bacterium]
MTQISNALNIAQCALFAQQMGVYVTSNNIANVNTPGYSRQKLLLDTIEPMRTAYGPIGRGVRIDGVKRAYDSFLASQIARETSTLKKWETEDNMLSQVESLFNEFTGLGISEALGEFWNAWQQLTMDPQGSVERADLLSKASFLAGNLNRVYSHLSQIQKDIDISIGTAIDEINDLSSRIADLNVMIAEAEIGNEVANDLRDQRGNLVKQLAEKINFTSFEDDRGRLTIMFGGGKPLVEGGTNPWVLKGSVDLNNNGLLKIELDNNGGTLVDITSDISGGCLGGFLEVRDTVIDDLMTKLDNFTGSLIAEVNKIHSQGEGLTQFSSVTGTTTVADPNQVIGTLTLPVTVTSGSFWITAYDASGIAEEVQILVDPTTDTLNQVITSINTTASFVTASYNGQNLQLDADPGYTFTFAHDTNYPPDSSFLLAALGVNTFFEGSDTSTISVNSQLESDATKIAAAANRKAPGDNTNALLVVDLSTTLVLQSQTYTFDGYYDSIVSDVGIKVQSASTSWEYQNNVIKTLNDRLTSVSGVSLDEEMVNLIKYQNAYDAAARLISVIDEMMETIVHAV